VGDTFPGVPVYAEIASERGVWEQFAQAFVIDAEIRVGEVRMEVTGFGADPDKAVGHIIDEIHRMCDARAKPESAPNTDDLSQHIETIEVGK